MEQPLANMNIPRLFVHRWMCAHEEVVNESDQRVDPRLATNPFYNTIQREAPHSCPQCTNPDASHCLLATNVVVSPEYANVIERER